MSATRDIIIDAIIDPIERPVMAAAAAQLSDSLAAASNSPWRVQIRLLPNFPLASVNRPTAMIASLLPELARLDEPIKLTEARWREWLASLDNERRESTFLCTIFRLASGGRRAAPGNPAPRIIERIRRLNRLAVDLSHDFAVGVIDIDRIFAHLGARQLQSDFRLTGAVAEEVAAYAVVSSLLAAGWGDAVPAEILSRALQFQGPLQDIANLVRRRLATRTGQGAP